MKRRYSESVSDETEPNRKKTQLSVATAPKDEEEEEKPNARFQPAIGACELYQPQ